MEKALKKIYDQKRYSENKEVVLRKQAEYRRKNIEKVRSQQRVYNRTSIQKQFNDYKSNATRRGLRFELTRDQWNQLVIQPCHYCGLVAQARNGVDRKVNALGYTIENAVPCCKTCNYAKLQMSTSEFEDWVRRIYTHLCCKQ